MIKYKNDKQKKFIKECIRRAGNDDVWHVSLFYTLGLTNDCQNNIDSLYDFNTGCVKQIKGEKYGWITGTDIRIIRLAYNLYNNGAPTAIFGYLESDLLEYCLEAIRIRFEIVKVDTL